VQARQGLHSKLEKEVSRKARKGAKKSAFRPWSSFSPMGEFVECGDSSPHGSESGDESPHSTLGGLNDDQGRII